MTPAPLLVPLTFPSNQEDALLDPDYFSGEELFLIGFGLVLLVYYAYQWVSNTYPNKIEHQFLPYLKEIPFYQKLGSARKREFERRVQLFINQKEFISRAQGFIVNFRMKTLIAATAVEITFGFKRFTFDHFSKILIYPSDYYSRINRRYHRGEVNPHGLIILSWSAFEEGHSDRNDGINLGVHEIAHAFKLENKIVNRNYEFIDEETYCAFQEAFRSFSSGYGEGHGFLRDYAKTNIHEFFAVCCENFIERPTQFKRNAPSLYRVMSRILRQDLAS